MYKGNLVSTISSMPPEYIITFSVKTTAFVHGYSDVLHFTTGGNIGKLGYRIPGIWFYSNRLHICGSVKGNYNYCANSQVVAKNKWINVRIVNKKEGSTYWYTVYVNGRQIARTDNPSSRIYKNVKVYATDPWYRPFQGKIQNLKIEVLGMYIQITPRSDIHQ